MPCAIGRSCLGRACTSLNPSAFSVMTTNRAEAGLRIRRAGRGRDPARRTVCKVVTIGIRRSLEGREYGCRPGYRKSVFVLETDDVEVFAKLRKSAARDTSPVLLVDLEANFGRVVVTLGAVVHRHDEAVRLRKPARRSKGKHVVSEGRDPALPGNHRRTRS